MKPSICKWFEDRAFAYSIAYDEAFEECITDALPIHREFGFPGHLNVVVGQIGKRRNCYLSSLNGLLHMGVDHIKILIDEGWGIGNHSYSHFVYPYQPGLNLEKEIVWSKYILEELISRPVRIFALPNDKYNYDVALPLIRGHYLACIYIDGGPNGDDVDLYKIGNFLLASSPRQVYPTLFYSQHPYDWKEQLYTENLSLEFLKGKWLLDTTHLVKPNALQLFKNITPEDLYRRFSRLKDLSRGNLWAATPDDVIDYILTRRGTEVLNGEFAEDGSYHFAIGHRAVPGVINRALTFKLEGLRFRTPRVTLTNERKRYPCTSTLLSVVQRKADLLITLTVCDGLRVKVEENNKEINAL